MSAKRVRARARRRWRKLGRKMWAHLQGDHDQWMAYGYLAIACGTDAVQKVRQWPPELRDSDA